MFQGILYLQTDAELGRKRNQSCKESCNKVAHVLGVLHWRKSHGHAPDVTSPRNAACLCHVRKRRNAQRVLSPLMCMDINIRLNSSTHSLSQPK
jgi:hypothetical protein